jgi:hypothetical protein
MTKDGVNSHFIPQLTCRHTHRLKNGPRCHKKPTARRIAPDGQAVSGPSIKDGPADRTSRRGMMPQAGELSESE